MLYRWFAESAAEHEDRTALEVGGEAISYGRLRRMAEHLAARLHTEHDVLPRRIALVVDRSVYAYVGYLAVQRLGRSVVPLNPAFPTSRTRQVLAAAGADLVLVGPGATSGPVEGVAWTPVDPAALDAPAPASAPDLRDDPESEAYLLFTSGSTGAPKGVPIRHTHVSAFLRTVLERYGTGPGDRCSQFFDLSFDPSVYDLFATWAAGATLVVPSRNDLLRPVRFVAENALTHWCSVPSAISTSQAGGRLEPGSMPSLRLSLFCGEPLTRQQALAWGRAAPGSTLVNSYGPTETTIVCSDVVLPADPARWPVTGDDVLPLGEPFPGVEYAVLDGSGHEVEEGELCVRGSQRFAGYLDPEENRGRFHPAPAATEPPDVTGDHWYRTGDRVTTRHGVLAFLGRTDQQVKVNGYRVELGEVEATLRALDGVTDVVVVAVAADVGPPGLYAVCRAPGRDPAGLRAELARDLPGYMVPRRVLTVDRLPSNANGKVDRRAAADLVRDALQGPASAPRADTALVRPGAGR